MTTEKLESKKVNGKVYYYYSSWGWKDGKCRRLWQRYLGKAEDIAKAVEEGSRADYAEVFQYGLHTVVWQMIKRHGIIDEIDLHIPERNQGLSVGEYISLAAANRAITAVSKRGMWDWLKDCSLRREFPHATEKMLSSQRFWDHMDLISPEAARKCWESIIAKLIQKEKIDLSRICYDGTNLYTFVSTFNSRCKIAKRGKNKQGRSNLRQIKYALFCTRNGVPLYYDVFDGNRNDAKEFPDVIKRFSTFMEKTVNSSSSTFDPSQTTVVFDKGNNSDDNIRLLDSKGIHFVGSVKLSVHPELAGISNESERFTECSKTELKGMKSLSVLKTIYGTERKVVVMFNTKLFNDQYQTVLNDQQRCLEKLEEIKQRLDDRAAGLIKGGKVPTVTSITRQCNEALKREFMKELISVAIKEGKVPQLKYSIKTGALDNAVELGIIS